MNQRCRFITHRSIDTPERGHWSQPRHTCAAAPQGSGCLAEEGGLKPLRNNDTGAYKKAA